MEAKEYLRIFDAFADVVTRVTGDDPEKLAGTDRLHRDIFSATHEAFKTYAPRLLAIHGEYRSPDDELAAAYKARLSELGDQPNKEITPALTTEVLERAAAFALIARVRLTAVQKAYRAAAEEEAARNAVTSNISKTAENNSAEPVLEPERRTGQLTVIDGRQKSAQHPARELEAA